MSVFRPEDNEHLLERKWVEDKTGVVYTLVGIAYAKDDWYWLMYNKWQAGLQWLSCVGSIENFGFTPEEKK